MEQLQLKQNDRIHLADNMLFADAQNEIYRQLLRGKKCFGQLKRLKKYLIPASQLVKESQAYLFSLKINEFSTLLQKQEDNILDKIQTLPIEINFMLSSISALYKKVFCEISDKSRKFSKDSLQTEISLLNKQILKFENYVTNHFTDNNKFSKSFTSVLDSLREEFQILVPHLSDNDDQSVIDDERFQYAQKDDESRQKIVFAIIKQLNYIQNMEEEVKSLILQKEMIEKIMQQYDVESKFAQENMIICQKSKNNSLINLQQEFDQITLEAKLAQDKLKVIHQEQEERSSQGFEEKKKQQDFNLFKALTDIGSIKYSTKGQITTVKNVGLSFHLIFAIDESSSVQYDFPQMIEAFESLRGSRLNLKKDKMTIIQFDNTARFACLAQPIDSQVSLTCKGGGTDFAVAFELAAEAIKHTDPLQQPVIILLTDGDAPTQKACQILKNLYTESVQQIPLWTFTVGFTDGYNRKALEEITRAGNGNVLERMINNIKFKLTYDCKDALSLKSCFQEISVQIKELDNFEIQQEDINQKRQELYEFQLQDNKTQNSNKIKSIQMISQQSIELMDNANATTEEKNKILALQEQKYQKIIKDNNLALEKLSMKILKIEQDIIALQNNIQVSKRANQNNKFEELLTKNLNRKNAHENDIDAKENSILLTQEKGFTGISHKMLNDFRWCIEEILEMPEYQTKVIAAISSHLLNLILDNQSIPERILNFSDEFNERNVIELTALKILIDNGVIDPTINSYNSMHLQEIIKFYLTSQKESNELVFKILQSKIIQLTQLLECNLNNDESENKKQNKKILKDFKKLVSVSIDELVQFDHLKAEPFPPDYTGSTPTEKIESLTKIRDIERNKGTNWSKLRKAQYSILKIKLTIEEELLKAQQMKLKKQKSESSGEKKLLKKKMEKLEARNILLKDKLKVKKEDLQDCLDPEKKKLLDQIMLQYQRMRISFSSVYEHYCQDLPVCKINKQMIIVSEKIIPSLKEIQQAVIMINQCQDECPVKEVPSLLSIQNQQNYKLSIAN